MNEARIIEGHFKLIHMIELDNYKDNLNNIKINIEKLKDHKKLGITLKTIRTKFIMLENSLNLIYPQFRSKRGLLNILGSGIKFITGNMDNDDAIEINNKIDEITLNNKQLIQSQNDQTQINQEMINRFKNITIHINDQQKSIENYLINIQNQINSKIGDGIHDFQYLQYIYQINFDMDILRNHLDDIYECIQMAKLNIISKNILSPNELNFIKDKLNNQKIQIDTLEQIYEHLQLQAFYNQTNLIFVIKIPKLKSDIFTEYLLEPIPTINDKTLDVPYDNILKNTKQAYFEKQKCYSVNHVKFCDSKGLINITNDKCYMNIINEKDGTCNFNKNNKDTIIKQLSNNHIILKNGKNISIKSNCNLNRNITGTILIKINNCPIEINGINYFSYTPTFKEEFYILPISKLNVKENSKFEQKLNLESLNDFNIKNKKKIEELHLNNKIHDSAQYFLIIILISIIIIIIVLKFRNKKTIKIKKDEPKVYFNSSESRLNEGGVIVSTSPRITI
jgi:Gypsy protein/Baculovirus F protein